MLFYERRVRLHLVLLQTHFQAPASQSSAEASKSLASKRTSYKTGCEVDFFFCCFVLCVHAERKPCEDALRRPTHRSCCGVWRQHKRVTTSLRRKLTPNVSSCVRPVSPSEGVAVAATQNRHSRCQRWDGAFRVSTQTNGLLHVSHRTLSFC